MDKVQQRKSIIFNMYYIVVYDKNCLYRMEKKIKYFLNIYFICICIVYCTLNQTLRNEARGIGQAVLYIFKLFIYLTILKYNFFSLFNKIIQFQRKCRITEKMGKVSILTRFYTKTCTLVHCNNVSQNKGNNSHSQRKVGICKTGTLFGPCRSHFYRERAL